MKAKSIRILSLILSIILVFSVPASAYTVELGDIDMNMKVEAADARTVLRASVGLEELDEIQTIIADADKDGKISAADARLILRTSVGLEEIEELSLSEEKDDSSFEIYFFDVGQADSALVICDNETMLIDGGNVVDGSFIVSFINDMEINALDYVICTHAHEDHVGGLSQVLDSFSVTNEIFAPETGYDTDCYKNFLTSVEKQNKTLTVPEVGHTFSLGSSTVEIIAPVTEDYSNLNNTSIVTKITYGENTFLLTGDVETEAEADILESGADISADVIKVGHHGGATSATYPFLREVMPEIAIISVSAKKYGHPTPEMLSRLRDADAKVYRTDMQGTIKITSDGKNITVTTEKNQDADTNPTVPSTPETPTEPPAQNETTTTPPETTGEYIGNINSKKLHLPSCSTLPDEENRIYFASVDTAINEGYEACKRCKPF